MDPLPKSASNVLGGESLLGQIRRWWQLALATTRAVDGLVLKVASAHGTTTTSAAFSSDESMTAWSTRSRKNSNSIISQLYRSLDGKARLSPRLELMRNTP